MGVSGCGKSTIGRLFAESINADFHDGDDFHPQSNIDKMSNGIALNDEDRQPWLESLAQLMQTSQSSCVIACSALKAKYRDTLRTGGSITFIYLSGKKAELLERLNHRAATTDHFMSTSLIDSQLNTLEDPSTEKDVLTLSISELPETIVKNINQQIILSNAHY